VEVLDDQLVSVVIHGIPLPDVRHAGGVNSTSKDRNLTRWRRALLFRTRKDSATARRLDVAAGV
jgi:hypothetical protein